MFLFLFWKIDIILFVVFYIAELVKIHVSSPRHSCKCANTLVVGVDRGLEKSRDEMTDILKVTQKGTFYLMSPNVT